MLGNVFEDGGVLFVIQHATLKGNPRTQMIEVIIGNALGRADRIVDLL